MPADEKKSALTRSTPDRVMRPRGVHIPYLVAAALFVLANVVLFHLPADQATWIVVLGITVVAFALHVVWLGGLYEDASATLSEPLQMNARRVRFLTVMTAPLYCLWAPFALRILFRGARLRAADRGEPSEAALAGYESIAQQLQVGGWLSLVVFLATMARLQEVLEPYFRSETGPEYLDASMVLGPTMLWARTLFQFVLGAGYVWFAATAVPKLYRALPRLLSSSART